MLKYRTFTIIFIVSIVSIAMLFLYSGISPWWFFVAALLYLFFLVVGSSFIKMSFFIEALCRFQSRDKIILSFDDGPDETNTPRILEVLKKHDAKAIFFLIGSNAEQHPELVKRISAAGHNIGNHSYQHNFLYDLKTSQAIEKDITKCNEIIKGITGKESEFFRPPYGVTNPAIKKALIRIKLIPVGWSLRTFDTVTKNKNKLFRKLQKVKPGYIILFHDRVNDIEMILDDFLLFCKEKKLITVLPEEVLKK
ncbi:MAG: polysaccharide deacetylase family protein [Bacteroidales bacterium]|nr:polysaccharide deacetylase family protein [Bacteroidales bacterium]